MLKKYIREYIGRLELKDRDGYLQKKRLQKKKNENALKNIERNMKNSKQKIEKEGYSRTLLHHKK